MQPIRSFPEDAHHARLVTAAYRRIHHALPSQPITLHVLLDDRPAQQYVLQTGLAWALTGAGYHLGSGDAPGTGPTPHVTVLFHGGTITVAITKMPAPKRQQRCQPSFLTLTQPNPQRLSQPGMCLADSAARRVVRLRTTVPDRMEALHGWMMSSRIGR